MESKIKQNEKKNAGSKIMMGKPNTGNQSNEKRKKKTCVSLQPILMEKLTRGDTNFPDGAKLKMTQKKMRL